jgi:hypothetical protein
MSRGCGSAPIPEVRDTCVLAPRMARSNPRWYVRQHTYGPPSVVYTC